MSDSERWQAMMLDHLYGLLEPEQSAELEAFLATPDGDSVRRQAMEWKRRLGAASKSQFPSVRFDPPPASSANVMPAAPQHAGTLQARKRSSWVRLGVTASILLVVLGIGTPLGRDEYVRISQAQVVDERKAELARAEQNQNDFISLRSAERLEAQRQEELAKKDYDTIDTAFHVALNNARAEQNESFITRLSGPESAQPGAPNFWQVETFGLNGKKDLEPSKVEWSVKDQNGAVLFSETKEPVNRDAFREPPRIGLPVSFWEKVKPGSDLTLEVTTHVRSLRSKVTAQVPIAKPTYVTHLTTDKPLYRPGETVRFRSLTVDRATFRPPQGNSVIEFRLTKPGGQPEPIVVNGKALRGSAHGVTSGGKGLAGPDKNLLRGIACGEFEIPANAPGGEYILSVVDVTPRIDWVARQVVAKGAVLESRKFNVINYKPELFEKTLEFDGKSYGAGDIVNVKITASRTQGGKIKNGAVTSFAIVDGLRINIPDMTTDSEGIARLRFTLPATIRLGQARLETVIRDGTDAESLIRPIPVVGQTIQVEFFPEGGDLVENVPNRVYFQATMPNGKPADLKGTITDGGQVVARASTMTDADHPGVNRGQGVFTFTPAGGRHYYLKLQKPVGIIEPPVRNPAFSRPGIGMMAGGGALSASAHRGFELPSAKNDGVVLKALEPVSNADRPIHLSVQSAKRKKTLIVGAYARGVMVDQRRVEAEPGQAVEVALQPADPIGGVMRITVFEEKPAGEDGVIQTVPLAERLIYRKPVRQLRLDVRPDHIRYNPGSHVDLDITARTETAEPTPAVVMVSVVNQSVVRMADEKTDRLMPTHLLLAGEVKQPADLEHADFLLGDEPQAATALDLLLGTQGWRRFAEQFINGPRARDREVERLLVANGQKSTPFESYHQAEHRIYSEFQPKLEMAATHLTEMRTAIAQARNDDPAVKKQLDRLAGERSAALSLYQQAQLDLSAIEKASGQRRGILFAAFCTGLVVIGAVCIVVAARRHWARIQWSVVAAGCFAVCGVAILVGSLGNRSDGTGQPFAARAPTPRGDVLNLVEDAAGELNAPNRPVARDMMPMAAAAPPEAAADAPKKGPRMMKAFARPRIAPNVEKVMPPAPKDDGEVDVMKMAARRRIPVDVAKGRMMGPMAAQVGMNKKLQEPQPMQDRNGMRGGVLSLKKERTAEDLEFECLQQEQAPGFYVREFSFHKDVRTGEPETRDDFSETVCWQPILVVPESGRIALDFQLSDAIARYQVLVAGTTLDGRLGATKMFIEARKPFTVDPKTPIEITANDRIDVPVQIVNDSDVSRRVSFDIEAIGLKPLDPGLIGDNGKVSDQLALAANEKARKLVGFQPSINSGEASLRVTATSDPPDSEDRVVRSFRVVPDGFPSAGAVSDQLEKTARTQITLPAPIKGTLKVQLQVYPTTLAELQTGLEGLLHEPNGCFEQTSSANYPNLLILDYLKSSDQAKPDLARKAKELLDRGYAKLISFECPDSGDNNTRHGFEWFGQADQQHQALTAYGLLQFKDLAKAYAGKVDPDLIKRTQQYLLNQQTAAKDGFKRNGRALDHFGRAPDYITNAYIVWSLAESDPQDREGLADLISQLDGLKKVAREDAQGKKDPYFLALVANGLLLRPANGNREEALAILDRIAADYLKDGCVKGATTSITCSAGRDLEIETTALAVLGWLRSGQTARFIKPVKESTRWISQQRNPHGAFGSTQSTILALQALIEFTKASRKPAEAGEIKLTVNGKTFKKAFTEKDQEAITLDVDNAEDVFKVGVNDVLLEISTKQAYPYSLAWTCNTRTPESSEKCAVAVGMKLDRAKAVEGETVGLNVSLVNKQDKGQGMAVAIVGLPGGCRLPADLKELAKLREDGKISYFEIRGRDLILYWRSLAPNEKIDLSIGLLCEMPGEFTGPAGRGYLYYNAEHKHWVEPLTLAIEPIRQPADAAKQANAGLKN